MNGMLRASALVLCLAWGAAAHAASVEEAVADVQREWETIKYKLSGRTQEARFDALAARAREVSAAHPDRAEPLIWEGIVVSSLAGARGGLGALGLVKQAKGLYETALRIRPEALDGSAYNSLGVLYYKVPGWPIGFGDKAKANELLQKALAINPDGIDPNFFYGEYLVETGRSREAMPYLQRALAAPPRAGREIADAGRRDEARALLEKVRAEAN